MTILVTYYLLRHVFNLIPITGKLVAKGLGRHVERQSRQIYKGLVLKRYQKTGRSNQGITKRENVPRFNINNEKCGN